MSDPYDLPEVAEKLRGFLAIMKSSNKNKKPLQVWDGDLKLIASAIEQLELELKRRAA